MFFDSKSYVKHEKQGIGDIGVLRAILSAIRKELRRLKRFNRYVYGGC